MNQDYFKNILLHLISLRKKDEHFYLSLSGENSKFLRVNAAKIRQIGDVKDSSLRIKLLKEQSGSCFTSTREITLTGIFEEDSSKLKNAITLLRSEVVQLPADPFVKIPDGKTNNTSEQIFKGSLLQTENLIESILKRHQSIDIAGIYAGGRIFRGMADTSNTFHWFETENFSFDYSLYNQNQKAVKGCYSGTHWDQLSFDKQIMDNFEKLSKLNYPSKKIQRGKYRVYLAPDAVFDLISMFSWGCIGERSIQQGESPLKNIDQPDFRFSSKFSLFEDFKSGSCPRFNTMGELFAETLPLIDKGKLINSLISTKSALEFDLDSNFAEESETLRSPRVAPGSLRESQILEQLGTGLYLSNLHYLNWSDQQRGRITGMTRYACFWVENGKIVCPIENLRWDETLFNLFGEKLIDFTDFTQKSANVSTYTQRDLGQVETPGALVSEMNFTL